MAGTLLFQSATATRIMSKRFPHNCRKSGSIPIRYKTRCKPSWQKNWGNFQAAPTISFSSVTRVPKPTKTPLNWPRLLPVKRKSLAIKKDFTDEPRQQLPLPTIQKLLPRLTKPIMQLFYLLTIFRQPKKH